MGRQRTRYKLVGRYMSGSDTAYYGLISEDGKQVKYTKEQMAFVVGRDQVINVKAQLYKDTVIFTGVGMDIRSLPTIKLGNQNITDTTIPKKQPSLSGQNNKHMNVGVNTYNQEHNTVIKSNKEAEGIKEIIDLITNNRHLGYRRLPEFSEPKIIKDSNTSVRIHSRFRLEHCGNEDNPEFIRDDEYILESANGKIYLRQSNHRDVYICNNTNKELFKSVILSLLGYVNALSLAHIHNAADMTKDYKYALNAYTGASNYYNDILRVNGDKYVDKDCMGSAAIETIYMLRKFNELDNNLNKPCILFRGGQAPEAGHIEKGFSSYSYSSGIARNFTYGEDESVLLCILEDDSIAINVESVAVCLDNGYDSEREVVISSYVRCAVIKQIGYIDGHPLKVIKYERAYDYSKSMHTFLNDIKMYARKMADMYLVYLLFSKDIYLQMEGTPYDYRGVDTLNITKDNTQIMLRHSYNSSFNVSYDGRHWDDCNTPEKCRAVAEYLFSKQECLA